MCIRDSDSSERRGLCHIGESWIIVIVVIHQSGKSKVQQIVITCLRADGCQCLDRADVHGMLNCITHTQMCIRDRLEEWLSAKRGGKVTIRVPKKGTKEKLVELAANNASLVLSKDKERLKREEGRTIGAVKEIARLLELEDLSLIHI